MIRQLSSFFLLIFLGSSLLAAEKKPATAAELVEGFEGAFGGPHPGLRRTHSKGFCVSGVFEPSAEARKNFHLELTARKKTIPVVGRFSTSGGDPEISDKSRTPRGMALQFHLTSGEIHQMAMLSTPVFGAATPESFLGLLRAQKMDPVTKKRNPDKIAEYIKNNPDTQAQPQWLKEHNPPASFAQSRYFSVSTFMFMNDKKKMVPVRWFFSPDAGEKYLTNDELEKFPDNFLKKELADRLAKTPATWTWNVIEGQDTDTLINPTRTWPTENHKIVNMGKLTIAKSEDLAACDNINFDPLVLSKGVEPSEDPILRMRSAAYAISFGKRQQEKAKEQR